MNDSTLDDSALYERYSNRPKHAESESLDVQDARLKAYCEMAGLNPKHVIQEPDTSAGIPLLERPLGMRLQSLLKSGVKHVVTQRVDRLFRNASDGIKTVEIWTAMGVSLHLADQGGCTIDTGTATGEYMFGQLILFAHFERKMIGERTKASMLHYQANGRRVGGTLKYGLMEDPDSPLHKRSKLPTGTIECPKEQQIIVEMKDLRYNCRFGYKKIELRLKRDHPNCRVPTDKIIKKICENGING